MAKTSFRPNFRPGSRSFFRFTFRSFALLLLFLSLLALLPSLILHFRSRKQIKELNAGFGSNDMVSKSSVPTLEEALMFISSHVKQIIIDAKVGPPLYEENLAADIMSVVELTSCKNCLMWSKFDSLIMMYQELYPKAMTGYIVMNDTLTGRVTDLIRIEGSEVVGVYHGLVTKKLVADVRRGRKKVHVWTVDEKQAMEQMLYEGVDCIITSNPRTLLEVMLQVKKRCIHDEGYFM